MEIDGISIAENGERCSRRLKLGDDEHNNGGSSSSVGGEDRLTSLPDARLVDILSLLPIKSAAATSVLSRRWRHLWTKLTRLRFSWNDSPLWLILDHKACTTIDHILRQLTSPEILSFHLDFESTPPAIDQRESYGSCVQSWIRQICGRNVEEIEVCFSHCRGSIPQPTCIFETQSQSLVVLELCGGFTYKLPDNGIISLPNLKKLWLDIHDPDLELMGLLLKSCPLLEDFYLEVDCDVDDHHFVDISAQCLKRLTIYGLDKGYRLRIDAPQLEYFEIETSQLSSHCFVRDLSCLLKAHIALEEGDSEVWDNRKSVEGGVSDYLNGMSELFRGISSVRSLYLSSLVFDCLYYMRDGDTKLPIFQTLTYLHVSLYDSHGWSGLLLFLQCSPNLEVLVMSHDANDCDTNFMDWTIPDSVPVCLLNKLKRVEIETLCACKKDLDFLGYILSKANVLERLLLRGFCYNGAGELYKELKFCEDLFKCPRSSVACEIEVSGKFLKASSNKGLL